jgi:adenosylcobinamide-GDP ribazoletransferase
MRGFVVACRYLTVLPLPRSGGAGSLGDAAGWFPAVGAVIGVCLAVAAVVTDLVLPPAVGAVLVVALWVALTGALHLDGLADTLDGLGAGWTPQQALAIMGDVRLGAYGVTGIVLVLGAKLASVATLPEPILWRAVVVAPMLGRLAPLLLVRLSDPARPDGTGLAFARALRTPALVAASAVAALGALALAGAWALLLLAATAGAAWAAARHLTRRLGGFTGDTLGALVEVTETLVLTLLSALAFLEAA